MSRRTTELLLLIAAAFPVTLLYALYVANTGTAITFSTLAVPLGLFAAFAAAHIAVRLLAPGADPAILPIVFVLSGIGITFVTRLAPDLAMNQLVYLFVSIALMVATLAAVRNLDVVARYKYTFGIAGIVLLILPIFIGTEQGGSKLWINFFGLFTIQPGEFAKVFIVLFLAGYLAENRELLAASNRTILGLKIPRLRLLAPLFVVWGVCLIIVAFERDLGSALLFYTIFLIMLYVATGRFSYVLIGIVLFAIGAFGMYQVMSHVQTRVAIWLDPFSDAQNTGYQLVQSLYSLAAAWWARASAAASPPTSRSWRATSSSPPSARRWGCSAPRRCFCSSCSSRCARSPRPPAPRATSRPLAPWASPPPSRSRRSLSWAA